MLLQKCSTTNGVHAQKRFFLTNRVLSIAGISLNGMENVATAKDAVERLNALLESGPKVVEGADNTDAVHASTNGEVAGKAAGKQGDAVASKFRPAAAALNPGITEKYRMWEEAVTLLYQVKNSPIKVCSPSSKFGHSTCFFGFPALTQNSFGGRTGCAGPRSRLRRAKWRSA